MMDAFVAAGERPGWARNDDFNGPAQDGIGTYQLTQRGGRRCSASVAYLHPALGRPNLTVETNVQVERVVFDGMRAVGVEASRAGEALRSRAEREVILSGGAYNSPQLLMLSGIGPAEHLGTRLIPPLARPPDGRAQPPGPRAGLGPLALGGAGQPGDRDGARTSRPTSRGSRPRARPADLEHGRGRRLCALDDDIDAPDLQLHAIPGMLTEDPPFGMADHGISIGVCLLRRAAPARSSWRRGPDGQAVHHASLLRRPGRHAPHGGRGRPGHGDRPPDGTRAVLRRARQLPTARGRHERVHPPPRADALPPGGHLRDGRGDDAVVDPSCACAASRACAWSTHR